MKAFVITLSILVFFLLLGAAYRVATMTPETEPLFILSEEQSAPPRSPQPAETSQEKTKSSSKQQDIADHLRGDSWEEENENADITEEEDFKRGEEILDSRESDLDEAKKKMNAVF